jgi:hypothetical protein
VHNEQERIRKVAIFAEVKLQSLNFLREITKKKKKHESLSQSTSRLRIELATSVTRIRYVTLGQFAWDRLKKRTKPTVRIVNLRARIGTQVLSDTPVSGIQNLLFYVVQLSGATANAMFCLCLCKQTLSQQGNNKVTVYPF